jgi:predicted nucleotidyltransferase
MVAGNATVTEWLRSPIVYRSDPDVHHLLLDLADPFSEPALITRHYAHVARMQ